MVITVVIICKKDWLKINETKSFSSQGNISTLNIEEKLCLSQCSVYRFVQVWFHTGKFLGTQTYILITPNSNKRERRLQVI